MNKKPDPVSEGSGSRHAIGIPAISGGRDQDMTVMADQQLQGTSLSGDELAAELQKYRSMMSRLELKCNKFEKQNELLSAAIAKNLRLPSRDQTEMRRKDAAIDKNQKDIEFLTELIRLFYRHPVLKYSLFRRYFLGKINRIGKKRGLFDSDAYLTRYPDVKNAEFEPVFHFALYGIKEGRII